MKKLLIILSVIGIIIIGGAALAISSVKLILPVEKKKHLLQNHLRIIQQK